MKTLVQEKVAQAVQILREKNIDCWVTFVRETTAGGDPILPLIYNNDLTWTSALIITAAGENTAIVGRFEAETALRMNAYERVIAYDQSIQPHLLNTLHVINPKQIAINYSTNDVHADGLSYGLYQLLVKYLYETPYIESLISAETLIAALRGRKTPSEVELIRAAVKTTEMIFNNTFNLMQPGMSEHLVATFMHDQLDTLGVGTAWQAEHCPAVNTGPNSSVGHSEPTNLLIERGHLVHFDFGVRQNNYCSDIQRVVYYLKPGETRPPEAVQRGFCTVVKAIQTAFNEIQPGVPGKTIDTVARSVITDAGYPEYLHATGHQLGRTVHDGAGILGPQWERYGDTPDYLIEIGQVYTLEPGVVIPGYGYVGLEEDILVTENGAIFLGEPQTELIVR